MSQPHRDKPDLGDASDTDEVYRLAFELAAWGLRNGECDEYNAVDWVLGHSHDTALPRGSSGRLNPTEHHITKGAQAAVDGFEPWAHRVEFDPEPLHALAERISGSGAAHERYLLGAIALCHRFQTLTPVITGPLLAGAVGVNPSNAYSVLEAWSSTLAQGFFTNITYDGVKGHGRVWTVDTDWMPVSKPKHLPGCNRAKSRCKCPGLSHPGVAIFTAAKDNYPKVRQPPKRDTAPEFAEWLGTLNHRAPVSVGDVSKQFGVTRAAATKLLRAQQGELLDEFTSPAGRTRKRTPDGTFAWVRKGEVWFVGQP